VYVLLFFAHIPFVVNHTFIATPPERLQHWSLHNCEKIFPLFAIWVNAINAFIVILNEVNAVEKEVVTLQSSTNALAC